ncbi:MAG: penicillin amidase [Saprospiraceae bacterium]|nr:MAG: penicillin amidase [Saprospiraceae bacterium]
MRNLVFFSLVLCFACSRPQGRLLTDIKIVRDEFGVPHIKAPTDREVAYGLAWAECEDDFRTLQEQMLAVRGLLGRVKGKEGIFIDFGVKFMGLREIVEQDYEQALSPEFKPVLQQFVAGVNNYAALHPKEVLLKKLFPLTLQDVLMGYSLGLVTLSGATKDLQQILDGSIVGQKKSNFPAGSNAIAISKKKTTDGKTYLAINSHQPLEGWYSWYEAHLVSDEGMNILGGTFPGGASIFLGANEQLGWAHTVNHADFSDVYALKMHPKKKLQYRFDGNWKKLEKKRYKAKIKVLGFLNIPIGRKVYQSVYGPTFKTKKGFFAWRFVAAHSVRAAEQWYWMNKANNFQEFKAALEMQGIPCTNIVYADREDNIYYISNGRLPRRNPNYAWQEVLPGDTSSTLWTNQYFPLDSLPQVLNPESGYVFNMNNTPFSASAAADTPKETPANTVMGYQETGLETNRSARFMELIAQYDRLTYEDFKSIKNDIQYPAQLMTPELTNLEILLHLNPVVYPDIADAIKLLDDWDRRTDFENTTAPLFMTIIRELVEKLKAEHRYHRAGQINEEDAVAAIRAAKKQLLKRFARISLPLGEVQRHIRGQVNIPLEGGPDVLAAMYSKPTKDGRYDKGFAGDSYIELVSFGENGVAIESINVYGSSARPESPHFTDQMEMFTNKQLKPMTLDWEAVLKSAKKVYSPMEVVY